MEAHAQDTRQAMERRLARCKRARHPAKTTIVYCKDAVRRGTDPGEAFGFLGYTCRSRRVKTRRGADCIGCNPAVSHRAATAMHQTMRRWRLHQRSDLAREDLARRCHPILRGWIGYDSPYYQSARYPPVHHLHDTLIRWAVWQYRRLHGRYRNTTPWLGRSARGDPHLVVHGERLAVRPAAG